MFDIGFLEILLIAVVALLVIGPERLPAVARSVGFWIGKVRRFVSSVQEDFQREVVKAEELKNLLEEQSKIKDMHEIIEQTVDESKKTVSIGADLSAENKSIHSGQDAAETENEKPAARSATDTQAGDERVKPDSSHSGSSSKKTPAQDKN